MLRSLPVRAVQAAVLAGLVAGVGGYATLDHTVTVSVDGTPTQVRTFAGTVEGVLASAGLDVGPHDAVTPALGARVPADGTVVLDRGRPVELTVDGSTRTVWVTARSVGELARRPGPAHRRRRCSPRTARAASRSPGWTLSLRLPQTLTLRVAGKDRRVTTVATSVGDLLAEQKVTVDADDTVEPAPESVPATGMTVVVVARETTRKEVRTPVAFGTERVADAGLYTGTEKVVTAGKDGVRLQVFEIALADGRETGRRTVRDEQVDRPDRPGRALRHQGQAGPGAEADPEGGPAPQHQRRGLAQLGRAGPVRERRRPPGGLRRTLLRPVPVQHRHLAERRRQRQGQRRLLERADLPREAALPARGRLAVADLRPAALPLSTSPVALLGPAEVRELAERLGVRPTKSLGQNFVHDANTVRRIVRTAGVTAHDVVVEVGPGLGSLTLGLLDVGAAVVAVEIDPVLAGALPETVALRGPDVASRLTVVTADALDVRTLPGPDPTTLVANLPYNVAVPVLLTMLARFPSLERALVMVQSEVADRLAAPPGSKVYGVPSVKAAWYATVSRAGAVGRHVFWPVPHVESGLVQLVRRPAPVTGATREQVFAVVDAAFAQRRKTLRAALAGWAGSAAEAEAVLRAAGVPPGLRGETLDVTAFARIAEAHALRTGGPDGSGGAGSADPAP